MLQHGMTDDNYFSLNIISSRTVAPMQYAFNMSGLCIACMVMVNKLLSELMTERSSKY